jgi:hypothetical protein
LTYLQINIPKIDIEFTAPLKIYDRYFNLVLNEIIRVKEPEEAGCRASLYVAGELIFIGHNSGQQGNGDAEIYLYQIIRESAQ